MITVMKASAGSGKTYTLAHKYIDLLMDNVDEFAYRHVLAVTFTNKATGEMKERILRYLSEMSLKDSPEGRKAGRILANIVHDYGHFAVSTIDKFFQQTLRSFARELGQLASYQVELDKQSLVEETVDRILDGLSLDNPSDRAFINFICESIEEKITSGKAPSIDGDLKAMAYQLRSEAFVKKLRGDKPEVVFSREELSKIKRVCKAVVESFDRRMSEGAAGIVQAAAEIGLSPNDFNGGSRSWFNWFVNCAQAADGCRKAPSDSVRGKASDPEAWFKASDRHKIGVAREALSGPIDALLEAWDRDFRSYNTAKKILKGIYGLSIAVRLSETFEKLMREKNLVCLDESNSLLKDIIDGSDTPFVYEKTGVRTDHFLLDEFQDTSLTQWDNFLPLLRESESRGGRNLLVGDIKQSIYRWRNSDWSLLDTGVWEQFPDAVNVPLQVNYRSLPEIVRFNNAFYPAAAETLDSLDSGGVRNRRKISEIYADVCQTCAKADSADKGRVEVRFVEDAEAQLDAVAAEVKRLKEICGACWGDVAVLVRKNDIGTLVASRLLTEGIPVITEASLSIRNSVSVKRLTSLMAFVANPDDSVNSFLAASLGISGIPDSYHSLVGLCEDLYAALRSDSRYGEDCECETMYVTAFMDYLADYAATSGNNLVKFLEFWADANPTISSPLGADAVKILTIHKSKGLDFPFVIIPFIEKIELFHKGTEIWSIPDLRGTPLEPISGKPFRIPVSSSNVNDDLFAEDAGEEIANQLVDAVNMMYVATTRASRGMLLLAACPKAASNSKRKEKTAAANFADILYSYCGGEDKLWGGECTFPHGERENGDSAPYDLRYVCEPLSGRLCVRPYAADFFTIGRGASARLSPRERGTALHVILSRIDRPGGLEAAVSSSIDEGLLPEESRQAALAFLRQRIESHGEFFPDDGQVETLDEVSIICPDGRESRPDRVLLFPDGSVTVVDYKFGTPMPDHNKQVSRYRRLLEEMGFAPVRAFLWYVNSDDVVRVD